DLREQADMEQPNERWRPVPGYEGFYEVSDLGRVRSLHRRTVHGIQGGLLRKPLPLPNGYLYVALYAQGKSQNRLVHRLVLEAFPGPCPAGMECRHLDGDQANNTVANLAWGTHRENILDKRHHGTDHNIRKTHCDSGHEFTPENTDIRLRPDG